jgi:hypothetical protein
VCRNPAPFGVWAQALGWFAGLLTNACSGLGVQRKDRKVHGAAKLSCSCTRSLPSAAALLFSVACLLRSWVERSGRVSDCFRWLQHDRRPTNNPPRSAWLRANTSHSKARRGSILRDNDAQLKRVAWPHIEIPDECTYAMNSVLLPDDRAIVHKRDRSSQSFQLGGRSERYRKLACDSASRLQDVGLCVAQRSR